MKSTTLNFVVTTIIVTLSVVHCVGGQAQENSEKLIHYSVRNLGTLGGVLGSSAHSINDQGRIAGVANLTGDTEEHAALWQVGVVTNVGTLGGDNSNVDFPVKNNDGLVVSFAQTPETDPLGENFCIFLCTPSGGPCNGSNQSCRGFRWRNGLMEPLGTLGGNNSAATGANNRGLVVGVAENPTQDPNCVSPQVLDYEAVVWWANTIHELSPVPGDAIGAALAVSDNGQIVGGTGMCGSGPGIGPVLMHAVLWKNHTPTDLGNLGGALNNVAYAINENGQVVGQSCDVNFNCRAFLWQDGVMTDLNTLTAGSPLYLISAADINSRGEIVGAGVDPNTGEPLAFAAVPCDEGPAAEPNPFCEAQDRTARNSTRATSWQAHLGKMKAPLF